MAEEGDFDRLQDDPGFVARWSRRKREAEAQQRAQREMRDETGPSAAEETPPRPVKTDADMPPLALLTVDSDLSDFFSPGVSEELRRRALRTVWSQPRFNVVDGLDDYAEDYSKFRPLGDLVTAGLRWHRQRIAARAAQARDTAAGADEGDAGPAAETTAAAEGPDEAAGEEATG